MEHRKRLVLSVSIFLFLFVATFIFFGVKVFLVHRFMANFEEPPVYVSSTKAELKTWNMLLTAVGSLKASNGVDVNSEVPGQILSIDFKSGEHVKAGDLLVQLNDDIDQQTLKRDEAKLNLDKVDFDRNELLIKKNAIAHSAVDSAKAAYLQSLSAVQSDKVMIAKKKIRAPFSGKIGIRQVNIGQYITTGTSIVSLQALDPLFVDFSLPETDLPLLKTGQDVKIKVDAYPDTLFDGKITAINANIDINTRSIAVRATVPNQDEKLFPGLFSNVEVILPEKKDVITVPQSAISYSLYGDSIYVIDHKGKDKKGKEKLVASQQYVKVGERRGDVVAITSGIKAGDEIVTSGQVKFTSPNPRVAVNNAVVLK